MRNVIAVFTGILYVLGIGTFALGSRESGNLFVALAFIILGLAIISSGIITVIDRLDDIKEETKESNKIMKATLLKQIKDKNKEEMKETSE